MVPRARLLQCQKFLTQRFKSSARTYLGNLPPQLKQYYLEYQRDFRKYEKIYHKSRLLTDVAESQIVLCGDYHSLSQAQRTVIRILREILPKLKKEKKPIYLALEILKARDNVRVQQYLNSEISEEELLKAIDFSDWGFSWLNYAPLFRLAKENGIPLVGLTPSQKTSLKERDEFAARVISHWSKKNPEAIVFCLMGDLHLAEKHLPASLKAELQARNLKRKTLVIHQNQDWLYWKLVKKKLEHKAEVVKIKDDVFCVLNTPPWIKLQSHLKWIEVQEELWTEEVDHTQEIADVIAGMAKFLGVKKEVIADWNDFEVHGPSDSTFLKILLQNKVYRPHQIRILSKGLREFQSQFFHYSNSFYLGNLKLNHLASLSAQYVHSKLSGFKGVFEVPARDFYSFIWVEALGFLGSKIVNPKRKCHGWVDFKEASLKVNKDSSSTQKAMKLAYQHLCAEERYLKKQDQIFEIGLWEPGHRSPDEVVLAYKVTKLLGKLLGQGIYDLFVQGQLSHEEIRALFETQFDETSRELYLVWTQKLDHRALRIFSYREKL
jgi:hypothetical protein